MHKVEFILSSAQEDSTDSEAAPENLSLKKNCASINVESTTVPIATTIESPFSTHFGAQQLPSQYQQKSPVDILRRVFPSKRRIEIEVALQRCKGDVLQAIEVMVSAIKNFILHINVVYPNSSCDRVSQL